MSTCTPCLLDRNTNFSVYFHDSVTVELALFAWNACCKMDGWTLLHYFRLNLHGLQKLTESYFVAMLNVVAESLVVKLISNKCHILFISAWNFRLLSICIRIANRKTSRFLHFELSRWLDDVMLYFSVLTFRQHSNSLVLLKYLDVRNIINVYFYRDRIMIMYVCLFVFIILF